MNKPKEIRELERIYRIELEESKPNEFGYRNTYAINADGNVTHLNLSKNQLTEIKGLETLVNLQYLDLSNNQLMEIKGLETLVNLKDLNLSDNQPMEIKGLETLVNLRNLWLSYNQLTEIKGLETLVNLQNLWLSNNQLTEIKGLERLVNLHYLDLSENQLTEIKGLETLVNLQYLWLSYNQLREIKGLETLVNLETLWLHNNQLKEIKGLETLVNLQNLWLHNNQLKEIKGLETLVNLQNLWLSYNQLTEIKGLDTLVNLQELDLSNNQLTEIKGLDTLVNLQELDLSNNQLTEIKGLETLVKLQDLYLSDNQLTEIKGLETLVNLQILWLANNQLKEIKGLNPIISSLKELWIDNNPFLQETGLSLEDKINHRDIIWKYLSDLTMVKVDVILPEKVMFLGNHRSGKSTFWYYLKTGELIEQESTHVLNIEQYHSSTQQPSSLPEAIIYDFGGQDYYHGLYRAFFTDASINMLFWCMESDTNDIRKAKDRTNMLTRDFSREYWMHQLYHVYETRKKKRTKAGLTIYPPEPLLSVQTHADTVNDKTEYKTEEYLKFTNTTGEFYISLDEKSVKDNPVLTIGLKYLKTSLLREIEKKRESIKEGEYYEKFLQYVLAWDKPEQVNVDTVMDNYKRDEKDIDKKRTFLKVELEKLSQKGIVLYYKDNPLLENVVWLNPKKTVLSIHKILSKDKIKKKHKGRVPEKEFNKLCENDKIRELLRCEKVIFCDRENKSGVKYIVPGYLPLSSEDDYYQILQFDFTKPNFVLKFRYFIPFGLINQLICHYGNNPDDKMFWRDQLIFTFNGEYKIWIKLDFSQLTITVYINPKHDESPILKLKEVEKVIFLNIIDMYWDREIRYKDETELYPDKYLNKKVPVQRKKNNKEEHELRAAQVRVYIEEKLKDSHDEEIESPEDMYLSVDGKYFVHHRNLEEMTERQDKITVYTLKDTSQKIKNASGHDTDEKVKVIDRDTPRTFPVYLFKNFSNNKNIKSMKKIFISYSRKDVEYKNELKKHLNMLTIFDIADAWSCEEITIGKWHDQIQKELEESDLIIYMLSANFFTSHYILDHEVKRGIELASKDAEKKILCVIVSDFVDLNKLEKALDKNEMTEKQKAITELADWQFLSYATIVDRVTGNAKETIAPLKRHPSIEQALTQIVEKILETFKT